MPTKLALRPAYDASSTPPGAALRDIILKPLSYGGRALDLIRRYRRVEPNIPKPTATPADLLAAYHASVRAAQPSLFEMTRYEAVDAPIPPFFLKDANFDGIPVYRK